MFKESITKENGIRSMKQTSGTQTTPEKDQELGLAEVVARLNTARKVGEFCSCDHPRCLAACRSASQRAAGMLTGSEAMIFSGATGTISTGGQSITLSEPYVSDYLSALHRAGIDEMRLNAEATPEGLVRFTRLICAADNRSADRDEIRKLLEGPVAEGIRVTLGPSARPESEAEGNPPPVSDVWQAAVRRRLGHDPAPGTDNGDFDDGPAVILADINPVDLARLINSLEIETDIGRISARFVAPYLEQTFAGGLNRDSMVPRRTIVRFIHLLRALSPGNQLRFITAALETSHSFTLFAAAVMEAVPIHLLAEVFTGIRPEEHTVHPRIVERFQQLVRLTGHAERDNEPEAAETEGPRHDSGEGNLLTASVLDEMPGAVAAAPDTTDTGQRATAGPGAEFSATARRRAVLRVLLDLFERATSRQEAETYAETLPPLFSEALDDNDLAGLARDWTDLAAVTARHRETKPQLGQALEQIRTSFLTIQNLEQLTVIIATGSDEDRNHVCRLLPALGDRAGDSLVLALIAARERQHRKRLLDAVVSLGSRAVPLALKRITDHRWYVVRNMIAIVRETGGRQAAERMLTLSRHPQFQVRKELMGALLSMGHPSGLKLVGRGLRDGDSKMRSACIGLLGSHRSTGSVEMLLGVLDDRTGKNKPFSQAQKASAIWALGQIGDPAALPPLHRRLRRRRLFSASNDHALNMAILRSLDGYPPEEAAPLASWGVDHGDDDEATACRRLLGRMRRRTKGTHR